MRAPNKVGGGAQTNVNGLKFEQNTSLLADIEKLKKYSVEYGCDNNDSLSALARKKYLLRKDCGKVLNAKTGALVAEYYEKATLYKQFLDVRQIDFKNHISSQLQPDGCLIIGNTCCIIEKKFQSGSGSVDEKLQTCDFKKKQYQKLFAPIGMKVKFIYLLNNWFDQPKYADVFAYIQSVGCEYYIGTLPLSAVGIK